MEDYILEIKYIKYFPFQLSMNQTRAEEITMREDYGNINLDTVDDGFAH